MATVKALIVDPDGSCRVIDLENSLGAFQAIVGGYIETIVGQDVTIYVNEEGLLNYSRFNLRATEYVQDVMVMRCLLAGTAIFVGPATEDGYDTDVRPTVVEHFNKEK